MRQCLFVLMLVVGLAGCGAGSAVSGIASAATGILQAGVAIATAPF